jgi:hypothetical protein
MSKVAVIDILPLEINSMQFWSESGRRNHAKKEASGLVNSFSKKKELKTVLFECISDLLSKRDTKLQ